MIEYPLLFPSLRGLTGITLSMESNADGGESPFNFAAQIQDWGGQRWQLQVTLAPLQGKKSHPYEAFFGKLNGREGTFLIGDPSKRNPVGIAAINPGNPHVHNAHPIRSQTLNIDTDLGVTEGYLMAGSHLQIGEGADATLYMLLDDIDLNADGRGSAHIWPKLRYALTGDEEIILIDPKGVFRLLQPRVDFARKPGIFTNIAVLAQENIRA